MNKKVGSFDEFRQGYFEEIAEDQSTLFNFFYEYNNHFGFINDSDYVECTMAYMNYKNRTFGAFVGSGLTLAIANKTVFRNYPKFPYFRPAVFSLKYIAIPLFSFWLTKNYFCKDIENTFSSMANKYQFGFHHYNKAMDIMERAYRANRLDEFMKEGRQFDWSSVPEFKSKYGDDDD